MSDSGTMAASALYTVKDLIVVRKVTQEYSAATNGNRNEAVLDLNLAMADTKTETMISRSLLSDNIAVLLRE